MITRAGSRRWSGRARPKMGGTRGNERMSEPMSDARMASMSALEVKAPIGEVNETRDDQCKRKRKKQQSYLWVSTIQLFLSAASTRINDFDFYLFWFLLAAADGCLLSLFLSSDQRIVLPCKNESSSTRTEDNSEEKTSSEKMQRNRIRRILRRDLLWSRSKKRPHKNTDALPYLSKEEVFTAIRTLSLASIIVVVLSYEYEDG
jgi:hypothetical protein